MKTVEEYRRIAEECRALAIKMDGHDRDVLMGMAEEWDRFADMRAETVNIPVLSSAEQD